MSTLRRLCALLFALVGLSALANAGHEGAYINGIHISVNPGTSPPTATVTWTDKAGELKSEVKPCKTNKDGGLRSMPLFELDGWPRPFKVSRRPGAAGGLRENVGVNPRGQLTWEGIPKAGAGSMMGGEEDTGTLPFTGNEDGVTLPRWAPTYGLPSPRPRPNRRAPVAR